MSTQIRSVRRSRSLPEVSAVLTWRGDEWDELPSEIRNKVRDHLDAAIDLLHDLNEG